MIQDRYKKADKEELHIHNRTKMSTVTNIADPTCSVGQLASHSTAVWSIYPPDGEYKWYRKILLWSWFGKWPEFNSTTSHNYILTSPTAFPMVKITKCPTLNMTVPFKSGSQKCFQIGLIFHNFYINMYIHKPNVQTKINCSLGELWISAPNHDHSTFF